MKRYITLEILELLDDWVFFKIKDQPFVRQSPFSINGSYFLSSNNWYLTSAQQPDIIVLDSPQISIFYTRGTCTENDNSKLALKTFNFESLVRAIKEYNKENNSPEIEVLYGKKICKGTCGVVLCNECRGKLLNLLHFTFNNQEDEGNMQPLEYRRYRDEYNEEVRLMEGGPEREISSADRGINLYDVPWRIVDVGTEEVEDDDEEV